MSDSSSNPSDTPPVRSAHGVTYEKRDLRAAPMAWTIAVLMVIFVGVYIVCSGLVWVFKPRPKVSLTDLPAIHELPPEPHLEVEGTAGIHDLHLQEDLLLNHYAWTDTSHTAVRIPIDRAIQLIAERGLPTETGKSK